MTNNDTTDDDKSHTVTLGEIADTRVDIVATGPKAVWCADVLSHNFEDLFQSIKGQAERLKEDDDE